MHVVATAFAQALDCARSQASPAWELRAAVSAARFQRAHDLPGAALAHVQTLLLDCTEGFGTVDLLSARAEIDRGVAA